jgi:hypothetical protein
VKRGMKKMRDCGAELEMRRKKRIRKKGETR